MSKLVCIFLGLLLISSCSSEVDLKKILRKTQRAEVVKFDTQGHVLKKREFTDKDAISKVFSVLGNSDAPEISCDTDFEIRCFDQSNKIIFLVELNSQELCNNAVFVYQDEMYHRYLNEGGVETLRTLLN